MGIALGAPSPAAPVDAGHSGLAHQTLDRVREQRMSWPSLSWAWTRGNP